jgi:hypothetical protein
MSDQAPMVVNGQVPPRRLANAARRPREYLTAEEIERLMAAAKSRDGRHAHRDATMILIAYRSKLLPCGKRRGPGWASPSILCVAVTNLD